MRVVQHFPRQFAGYSVQPVLPNEGIRSGIQKISDFYTSLIGLPRAPTTIKEWLSMEEVKLASACNGQIFSDPPGVFTAIRNGLLAYYPEDVRLRRLAKHTAIAAQTGQYNLKRCLLRGDNMAAYFAKAKFLESVVAIVFLLNRRYRPFYKWAYRGMRELQILSQKVYPIINSLAEENQPRKICESVEEISSLLIQELRHQSLSTSDSDFLMDHCGELLLRIEEPQLRTKPISLAF